MFEVAIKILKEIESTGYSAYIVGGYVRDSIIGYKNDDIDITTSAKPETIKNMYEVVEDNSNFGSLKIKKDNFIFEITTFRKDIYESTRFPKIEYTDSLYEDLKRRDFTINTICIDSDEAIIDLMGGIEDIEKRLIRCVKNADTSLKEDPLRILRAIRFMGYLDFNLDKKLEESIINNKDLVKTLSNKRINSELSKMNDKSLDKIKSLGLNI